MGGELDWLDDGTIAQALMAALLHDAIEDCGVTKPDLIYRIGDRNLLDTVVGRDFQSSLYRYDLDRIAEKRGFQAWKGEMSVENALNTDVTTAFPVGEAIGALSPGVYIMVAQVAGAPQDEFDALAAQWFIVSDLGLTAFSGNDGINVFVNSLATTDAKGGMSKLMQHFLAGQLALIRSSTSAD